MRPLETLRQKTYWILDSMKGSPIGKQLSDIDNIMSANDAKEKDVRINGYVKDILKYATLHVPFYRSFEGRKRLEDFPVVNKNIIRDNEAQFLSDSERSICAMIWSETATSALFLNAPVANAFGAPR